LSKRLRYQVAVSLDGIIAGPNGEYDWIVMDPSIDFNALYKEFDTVVMGRKTYEVTTAQGGNGEMPRPVPPIRYIKPAKASKRTGKRGFAKRLSPKRKTRASRRSVK
jgi:dihydrofolate reductase